MQSYPYQQRPSRPRGHFSRDGPADLLEAARRYQDEHGWTVIPIRAGTKAAAVSWKRYQSQRAGRRTLARWFARGAVGGLAVVLGEASGGLGVRDFDEDGAYERWAADHPALASTLPTVRPSRGAHLYARTAQEGFEDLGDGEWRADPRHYCLLPPSVHPDGPVYRWLIPLRQPLPLLDPVGAGFLPAPSPPPSGECLQQPPEQPAPRHTLIACVPRPPISTLNVSDSGVVNSIVNTTLPTGYGERNRRLFDLARGLKAVPGLADATAADLEPVVRQWWTLALPHVRTKSWSVTWEDFGVAWGRARQPARGATLAGLREWVFEVVPLVDTFDREAGDLLRLELLAEQLHDRHQGRPFPLACRVVSDLLGVSKSTAARHLARLVKSGVLRLETPAEREGRRASEYVYTGATFAVAAEGVA